VRSDDNQIHSLADCRKRLVGTLSNTAASRLMEKEGVPFRGYAEPLTAYRDLELKRIDAVLMDVPMEIFYARANLRLKPPENRSCAEPTTSACEKETKR